MKYLASLALVLLAGCQPATQFTLRSSKHYGAEPGAYMKHVWYYADGDECGETYWDGNHYQWVLKGTKDGVFLGGGYKRTDGVYVAPTFLGGTISGSTDFFTLSDISVENWCLPPKYATEFWDGGKK